jgi:hypothetical protein
MVDATTNRIIAHVTRHEAPSTDTLIELLRDCVARNHTVPTFLVVDWGPDNRSRWLQETLGQFLKTTIIYRQVATGASGSPVEGKFLFNDVNLLHQLSGSTEALKRARLTTGAMLPNKYAIWTLKDLQAEYEEHYKTFNSTPYGNAKQSPDECERELCKIYGSHPRAVIPLQVLDKVLLPFVERVVRKVDKRCRIFVNRTYYASDTLGVVRGKHVTVRYRPGDPRVMIVTHPDLPGIVECPAVSTDVKYALSAPDAHEAVVLKNLNVPEVKARKAEAWALRAEQRETQERRMKKQKRAAEKAEASRAIASEANPSTNSNVVPFQHTQGGLTGC